MFGARILSLLQANKEVLSTIIGLAKLVTCFSSEQEYRQAIAIFSNYVNPNESLGMLLRKLHLTGFSGHAREFVEEVDRGCWKLTERTKEALSYVDANPVISVALTSFLEEQRERYKSKKRSNWLTRLLRKE